MVAARLRAVSSRCRQSAGRCAGIAPGVSAGPNGPRPADTRDRRSDAAARSAGRAGARAPGGCPPGCRPRRGRGAGRRARARRWPYCTYDVPAGAHAVVVGDLGAAVEEHGVADLAVTGLAVGPGLVGVGRFERRALRGGVTRAGWVMPVSFRCSSRYEVRQCAGRSPRSSGSSDRPSVNDGAAHPGHGLERRGEIGVAGELRDVRAGAHAGTAHEQRHVDVGLVRRLLPGRHAVLAEVEAVVGREHDVRVRRAASSRAACAPGARRRGRRPAATGSACGTGR